MEKNNTFQLILLFVFGAAAVVGILIFSGVIPGFKKESVGTAGTVVVWGTASDANLNRGFAELSKKNEDKFSLVYVRKDPVTFETELTEALASGTGPDVIIAPHEVIFRQRDRIYPFSAKYYPKRNFYDTFVDGARLFEVGEAYYALPIGVDPLVLYYNKDIYNTNGLSSPPKTWVEFVNYQPRLTILDDNNNLKQSAAALGNFLNIDHAKDIFSLLLLQAGNPIVALNNGVIKQTLADNLGYAVMPTQAALEFFVQFADPAKSTYSWNRSWPSSRDSFLAGKLANYFGPASEYAYLKSKNPHLNFDVAEVPQQSLDRRQTFGRFYGLAIMRSSPRLAAVFPAVYTLSASGEAENIAAALSLQPAKRMILAAGSADPYTQIFYEAALVARAWLDFNSASSRRIFSEMIDNYSSGRLRADQAIKEAAGLLNR
ncbi:MAG TPA: extracellular solute-binding protein [Candidatus Paceibacterota bacterium]|nr:extracellular solute-binding protein [Candidatus Paceibacterota bacterium]